MPTTTVYPEADVATRRDTTLAAGLGDHLPIGYWGSALYRSAIRFPIPAGWASWTSITKATLYFSISDHQHIGPTNSSIYVRRNVGGLWTKSAGSQDCESGFSAGNNTQAADLGVSSSNQVSFASGSTANARKSVVVTGIVNNIWAAGESKIVFVFDPVGSSDVTELWSREKGSTYLAALSIDYEVQSPPVAPTLVAPAAGAVSSTQNPTFSWTHSDPQGDPQTNADIQLVETSGPTVLGVWHPSPGSAQSIVAPVALTRGLTYSWKVATYDAANGIGAFSPTRLVTIQALPVVTIPNVRYMDFAGGAPRLRVKWTNTGGTQTRYRVQSSTGYDSGFLTGTTQNHLLSTMAVTDNVAVTITVTVEVAGSPAALQGSANRVFTPRYGLTSHRKDMGSTPVTQWGTPVAISTVPTDAKLVFEYGSNPALVGAPTAWYSSLSSVPLAKYLFWRAWFIPSATASPVLDKLTIPVNTTTPALDKWSTTLGGTGLAAPWGIDEGEYVYGTRSITARPLAAGPYVVYSAPIQVRGGRSYILTGLMKAEGNAGAAFRIVDSAGAIVQQAGVAVQSPVLVASADWFNPDRSDVVRYKTPVWVAPSDMTVYVGLRAAGAGTQCWYDAVKLEESTVATPWSPGAVGATVVDAGGVQVDASAGGVFRVRGTGGQDRDVVASGPHALLFAGDTELYSPATGILNLGANPISVAGHGPSDHGDVLRSFWLPVSMGLMEGGAAIGNVGTTPNLVQIATLADAAASGVIWSVVAPGDIASGAFSITPYWVAMAADAVAHAVRWNLRYSFAANAGGVTGGGVQTAFTGNAVARAAASTLWVDPNTSLASGISAGSFARIELQRLGADALDTYVGVVGLVGILVSYTATG